MRITPQNALKLSAWLASQHPDFFREIVRQVTALQRSPLGRLGLFGDESGLDTITITADSAPATDFSSVDLSSFDPQVSLSDISFDPGALDVSQSVTDALSVPDLSSSSVADTSGSSSSFWSSIGSGISSVAGSVSKVASALVNPQTLSAVASAAGSFFTTQAKTAASQAQLQAQQAVLQSQLNRVAQGAAPAPISYTRNPLTGALVPVYNTPTGAIPVTQPMLSQLSNPVTAGVSTSWFVGGGIALALVISLLSSNR